MFGMPDASLKAMYLIKTHFIVKVIEFHPEDQTVDVIQDVCEFCNVNTGSITVQNELGYEATVAPKKPTVFFGIPVKQERWGQFEIQCCPQEGDTGYLEVFTNDISDWVENGGPSIPMSDRHFAMDSCVFVPFIPNKKNCVDDYPADGTKLVIKSRGAKITITDNGEKSDVSIEADTMTVTAADGVSITGDVSVDGKINATKDIKSDTDVKAGPNNTSLTGHTHNYVNPKEASPTQPGTTTAPVA